MDRLIYYIVVLQIPKEQVLKFYHTMTLLNTMDRILYESQRQVGAHVFPLVVGAGLACAPRWGCSRHWSYY